MTQSHKAFLFDLDGTLLETLPDLVALTNGVLQKNGYPKRTKEEIQSFIGNGMKCLMVQAVPSFCTEEDVQRALMDAKTLYPKYGYTLTKPYVHVEDTLNIMKSNNIKLGVLSNKFDQATRAVIDTYLPNYFDIVRGECKEFPRKPDTTGVLRMLSILDVAPQDAVYVGDSASDMECAKSAGLFAVGASWGYQDVARLKDAGADVIANDFYDLLELVY